MRRSLALYSVALALPALLTAQPSQAPRQGADTTAGGGPRASQFSGLRFRGIGPAMASGRVGEIAIHPRDKSVRYLAVHSGGVWKSVNAGTTWSPIFDGQASYSIGTLAIDPSNPLTVWVGTGENNSQRSVGWGDGIYKSTDGGRSWNNLGLKESFHIGRIVIDPRASDVVSRRGPRRVQDHRRGQELETGAQARQ
jgi:photosystem II stability/assembly factor-like uncharacterized protein